MCGGKAGRRTVHADHDRSVMRCGLLPRDRVIVHASTMRFGRTMRGGMLPERCGLTGP